MRLAGQTRKANDRASGTLRRGVLDLFLEGLPDGVIPDIAFFVRLFLAGDEKTRFAFRNFRSGCRLSAHKSPYVSVSEVVFATTSARSWKRSR